MADRYGGFCAFLVVLLASFSILPLLQPYLFASDDGVFHLYRLMEYDTVLRDGVWYPRWAPDFFLGLGMPLFNYYAPLTYYMAELFRLLGAGYIDSLQLFVAVAMAGSGFGAYIYLRTLLSPLASLLGAVVYMYVPYHVVNLYYRGDLPEYAAYTWFPLILWAVTRLLQRRSFVYLFAASVFYSALILTHNLSALLFSGFLVIYSVAALLREHLPEPRVWREVLANILRLGATYVSAWALTAFFWVPALAEKSLVSFDRVILFGLHEPFPTLEELFSRSLIHRYSALFSSTEVYRYQLGMLQSILLTLGLLLLFKRFRRYALRLRIEAIASLLVIALSLFLILPVSTWVWVHAPLLSLTQFSWRFLAFIALPSALLAGSIVELSKGWARYMFVATLVPLVVFSSTAGLFPIMSNVSEADISPRGSLEFELAYGITGTSVAAEYLPQWVKERPTTTAIAVATVLGEDTRRIVGHPAPGIEAVQVEKRADGATYRVHGDRAGTFVPNILYFPGWVAYIDGRKVDTVIHDPSGLVGIEVPEGDHTVSLRFAETPLRQMSDVVSAFSALILLGLFVASLGKRRPRGMRFPLPRLNTENLAKVGIVVVLVPVWLLARGFHFSAYEPTSPHRFPRAVNMGNEVLIEGYELSGVAPSPGSASLARPGSPIQVGIFWHLLDDDLTRRYRPFIRLTNNLNRTWAYAESPTGLPEAGSKWGATIATNLDMKVPYGTPPGVYHIDVGVEVATTKQLLDARRVKVVSVLPLDKGTRLGPIIMGRSTFDREMSTNVESFPLLADPVDFGDRVRLLDLSLAEGEALSSGKPGAPLTLVPGSDSWQIRAGDVVHLNLLWQALRKLDDDLTVTVRLAGADGNLWAIRDSEPADGMYPTTFWAKNEVVRDQLDLAIQPETPPGRYELQLAVVSSSGSLGMLDRSRTPAGATLRIGKFSLSPSVDFADPEEVQVQRRVDAFVMEGLRIVGYSLGRRELQPGEQLHVDLIWQATKAIATDIATRLELVDKTGRPWASDVRRPVGDAYPTLSWRPGEVLRGQYSLTPRASTPEGQADLVVEIVDATSNQSLGRLNLDEVRILPRTRSFTSAPSWPLVKVFGGEIRLLGYDVASGTKRFVNEEPEVAQTDTLKVTLHWQAMEEMSANYTVFVQVLDSSGRLVGQHDSPPQEGKTPTTTWVRGEVVTDEHNIPIPPNLPKGDYTVIAGIYDAVTGNRLPVNGGGDFIILTPLRISPEVK